MNWLKWFIGSAVDPKFAVVARRTGQNVAAVLAVWAMLLERAGQSDERGSVAGFDCEGADVVLGLDDGAACAIIDAMRSKGLIDEQQRIANWDKRQAQEESEAARERKRLQREREKLEAERLALEKARVEHAAMSQDVTNVTDCHAMSQDVTNVTPKRRIEEIRNINTHPLPLASEGEDDAASPSRSGSREEGTNPRAQGTNPRAQGTTPRKSRASPVYSADFDAFWQAYPRKVGKDAAYRVWKRKRNELPPPEELAAIIARQCHCEQWQRDGGQYIPHPATWLNQGRWLDELETAGTAMAYPEGW